MDRRFPASLSLFFVSMGFLFSSPNAVAAPKDAAAIKLADEAINRDYLATNFAEAEKKLRQAIAMCGPSGCIPVVVGRLHRDLGVVLIAGLNKRDDGKQELAEAIRADPDVALEKDLTTPEIDQIFKALKAGGLPPPKATAGAAGEMIHSPPTEQRTLTAVPIYVELPEGVAPSKVIARYKPYGTPDWKTLELRRMGTGYGGEVPCMDVGSTTGDFVYYVQATDASGEVVGTNGTRAAPNKVVIKNEPVSGEPPHLPGRPPPSRCHEAGDCPPGMPGCGKKVPSGRGWGATCSTDSECGSGYWCKQGACENGTRVETDGEPQASGKYCDSSNDCETGERCSVGRVCERAPEKPKKVWLSLNVGQDFSLIGTQADVCGSPVTYAPKQYSCIDKDSYLYSGVPVASAPGTGNAINGGFHVATTRVLAGAEFLAGDNVTLGARLGYAHGTAAGSSISMFHAEARVAFWFGKEPFSRRRVRPFLVVAGGLAEVDDKFYVPIIESDPAKTNYPPTQTLTVWRKSGSGFAGGGGGIMIPTVDAGQGVTAEIKIVALFPDAGVAMAPSIGYALGL